METKQEILEKLTVMVSTLTAVKNGWESGTLTAANVNRIMDGVKRDIVTVQFKLQELLSNGNGKTASGE